MPYGFRISFNFGRVGFDRLCCSKTDDGCRRWWRCCFCNPCYSTVDAFWLSFIHEFSLFSSIFLKNQIRKLSFCQTQTHTALGAILTSTILTVVGFFFESLSSSNWFLSTLFAFSLSTSLTLSHSHLLFFVLTVIPCPPVVILSKLYLHGEHVFVWCSAFVLSSKSAHLVLKAQNIMSFDNTFRQRLTPEPKPTTNEKTKLKRRERERKEKIPKYNAIFSRALFLYSLLFCVCVCCICTTCIC